MEVLEWIIDGIGCLFDLTDIVEAVYEAAAKGYRKLRGEADY